MKIVRLTLFLLLFCVGTAYALPPIQVVDTNKDGNVTWEEFSEHFKGVSKDHFDAIDENKDGSLNNKEFSDFRGRMRPNGGTQMMQKAPHSESSFPVLQPPK